MPYQFDDFHLTLSFDVFPPSLNGNEGMLRMHWSQYTALRTEWEQRIWYALTPEQRALFQTHWFARCALIYTRRTTHRTGLDWVNLAVSLKISEDALVRCGVLQDDNPTVVHTVLTHQEHVASGRSVRALSTKLADLNAHIDRRGRGSLSETEQLLWRCGQHLDRALFERAQAELLFADDLETATHKAARNEVDYLTAQAQVELWRAVAARHGAPDDPLRFHGWLLTRF